MLSSGLISFINKLSFISNKNLLFPGVIIVKSSKDGLWSQNNKWSRTELSADGLTLLKVYGEIPICSPDFTLRTASTTLKFINDPRNKFVR